MVIIFLKKVGDFELVFELEVKDFGLLTKFGVNIDTVTGSQNLIDVEKVMGIDGILKLLLTLQYLVLNSKRPANWSLLLNGVMRLEHPEIDRALLAEKLATGFTEVANVLKVELAFTIGVLTSFGLSGRQDELLGLWFSGQV